MNRKILIIGCKNLNNKFFHKLLNNDEKIIIVGDNVSPISLEVPRLPNPEEVFNEVNKDNYPTYIRAKSIDVKKTKLINKKDGVIRYGKNKMYNGRIRKASRNL